MTAAPAEPARPQPSPAATGRRKGARKGPRPKRVPQRMCVSCREHDAKRGLIRIVRTPEERVALDPTGRKNGRGAYLCHKPACWERALKSGALARALKTEIDASTAAALRDFAATLPRPDVAPASATGGAAVDRGGRPL